MKKLFMFLAVAGLATFGAACSSDDGGTPPLKALVAKATPATVEVNENVTFSATVEGKAVDGVKFYNEGKELGNPHKFAAKGEYKVIAKKAGFDDSVAITVKVTEASIPGDGGDGDGNGDGDTEKKTLTLTIAPASVELGEAVTFYVMEGATNVTTSAKIYVNDVLVNATTYTAEAVGTYSVIAKKEGANDSEVKTFEVTEAAVDPGNDLEANKLWYNGAYYDVNYSYYELVLQNYGTGSNLIEGPVVYNHPDGGYANMFYINGGFLDEANGFGDDFYVGVLVKNPTIVVEGTSIVDFGEMVLPGTNNFFMGAVFNLNGSTIGKTDLAEGVVSVTSLVVNDDLVGTTAFELSVDDDADMFRLDYTGSTFVAFYNQDTAGRQTATHSLAKKSSNGVAKKSFGLKGLKLNVATN